MESFKSHWNHFKYLLRNKVSYEDIVDYEESTICKYCGKPAKINWVNFIENIGHGEPFFNGMHLDCFVEAFGKEPEIFSLFKRTEHTATWLAKNKK